MSGSTDLPDPSTLSAAYQRLFCQGLSFLVPSHPSLWSRAAAAEAKEEQKRRIKDWAESVMTGKKAEEDGGKKDEEKEKRLKALVLGVGGGGLMLFLHLGFGHVSSSIA